MTNIYCSQGHKNPSGSRFCLQCGDRIGSVPTSGNQGIQAGQTLGDRYVIIRQIGQGGFGKTYLAEDLNRFREACVLKEFSPQVQTPYIVQKAEELFQREASVLYKLQHPQIPRFRELLRINLKGKESLFLVQDYIDGETYNSLLNSRQKQGLKFTEIEIRQLLQQILPVLEYIHALGVIHRDISPDNLMLRSSDKLPVLIDFGGVKQVAATVASQYYQTGGIASPTNGTLLGKIGFAPPEQMQTGMVSTHSDLYALAVTVLVLLTGKQPQELIDTYNFTWQWRREIRLSSALGEIIDKMLSPIASDAYGGLHQRYQTARQVLQVLNPQSVSYPQTQPPTSATVAISPPKIPVPEPVMIPTPPQPGIWTGKNVLILVFVLTIGSYLYWQKLKTPTNNLQGNNPIILPSPHSTETEKTEVTFSPEERQRKQKLSILREELDINYQFYVKLVNQLFREKYPNLKGRILSDNPEDENLRAEWDKTAAEVLEKLTAITPDSRRQLGTYTGDERATWKAQVNQINVGSRSLYDLGDAAFFREFPEQKSKSFIKQPIGQVWYAFVNDQLNAILDKSILETIVFPEGTTGKTVSGTLQPGKGKVFIVGLTKDQNMEVKLEANSKVLLSIYSPSGKNPLLQDSQTRTISATLPEKGFYEFVVVSTASESVDYQLTLTAENPPEPEPIEEPTLTETPTPENN
ncbi:MAG: serine/threonine-protein kinase [Aphanizomenon gracile PMC649.10]|jgi:serine/threonine protein kinase, bacterial|nr:serine/threonine-protein kinase [Aphanizomenon gracile PMC638.10]MDM3850287.1 serine/threonine-protein kinase [Aphanizomenon gracile PMC627.10]MDM3855015.1 serine/threonine-protein kinase [Aphanizomenon gracile PMC649.10]MDM3862826.1 serine/threonine-protein kinase [Aphanizomenon gracile PMC644.10]